MRNLLLSLAGVRRDILEEVPDARPRFLAFGLSILLNGVLAGAVAALAFTRIDVNVILASVSGFLIGLLFIGLDSVLIAPAGPGRRIFAAAPRVLLALLCGAIFSTAILVGSLRSEIDQQLAVIKQNAQQEFSRQLAASSLASATKSLRAESNNLNSIIATGGGTTLNPATDPTLRTLQNQLSQAQAAESAAFEKWQCELYGTSVNGNKCNTPAGAGALAQAAQSQYETDANQVRQLQQQIDLRENQLMSSNASARSARVAEARGQLPGVQLELAKDQQTLAAENANFTAANNNDSGILRKIQALDDLTSNNSSVRYGTLILFLLISVILCNPVFLRIVQRSGPYEMRLELAQRQEELRAQYRMRATAAEGELLEQVLDFMDRNFDGAKSASAARLSASSPSSAELSGSSAANGGTVEEIEDVALRGMQDMRSAAYPDAGQTAN